MPRKSLSLLYFLFSPRRWVVLWLLLLPALAAAQQTSVYGISDGERTLYLAGTVHLLRASDYPLPEQFNRAYDAADVVYFETDMGMLTDMSMQMQMMQRLTYQDGRTLRSVLNDEAWQALEAYTQQAGIPLAMMQNFRPGLLISTLAVLEFQRMGFTPQGVDAYFHTRAMGDGKRRGELESVEYQIDMLAGMGEGYESDFVLYSLADFEQSAEAIETIVSAWRTGDMDILQALFVDDMQQQAPALYDAMLVARNHNWMPTTESLLAAEDTALVLVGAAHLVGEDGLLVLLQQLGYSVTPL